MVRSFWQKGTSALISQQQTILSAATVIGFIYLLSAGLGFIRNRILSGYFGDSAELGIYFAADDIPSFIFTLIVSGSMSAAFVPVFIKYFKKDENEAWQITSVVMNSSIIGIGFFTIVMFAGAEFFAKNILALNSNVSEPDLLLLADLMKVLMIAQIFFLFSSYFSSLLQSFKRFVIPAMAPFFMNLGAVIFILLFTPSMGIYAPAWGTVFGAVLHMFFQLPFVLKIGFKYTPMFNVTKPGVLEIYKLMIPRVFAQVSQRVLIPLNTNLALFISAPSNVILTFADDLQTLPVRIFGMSIGQAALPIFAMSYKSDDDREFKTLVVKTVSQVFFLVMPVAMLFFILRVPLVRLAYGAEKYSWEATVMTSYTLGFFCISLIAQALIFILSKAYYAMSDTRSPLIFALIATAINILLAISFVRYLGFGVWSLALAFSISTIVNCVLLIFGLVKKINSTIDWGQLVGTLNKIVISAYLMGLALYIPMKTLDRFIFDTTRTIDLIILTAIVCVIGFITYFVVSKVLKVEELVIITKVLKRLKINKNTNTNLEVD